MTSDYVQEMIHLWIVLAAKTGRSRWAAEGIKQALVPQLDHFGPAQSALPANLWWWLVESATHQNVFWLSNLPLPQRECVLRYIRKLTGYTPPR